jgi:hypothetical protein
MACRVSSSFNHRKCVLLDEETLGWFPAEKETVDAETLLALKVFAYNVKQVFMVRYAKEQKVPLWIPAK